MSDTQPTPTLGENILRYRLERGLSQSDLGLLLGFKNVNSAGPYISRLEAAKSMPHIKTLQRIAEALGVSVKDLLP